MKIFITFLSLSLLICASCNQNKGNSTKVEKLYIKTTLAEKPGSEMKTTETISEISSDYFEVSLSSQTDGGYHAQKDVIEPIPGQPFKAEFFQMSEQNGTLIKFMTSTEFLNFMSAHGYELVNQITNEYGGDYTFKRKK
jgi:hypothetical protein